MKIELHDESGQLIQAFTAKEWSLPKVVTFKDKIYGYSHPINNGKANRVGHAYKITETEDMGQFIAVEDEKKLA